MHDRSHSRIASRAEIIQYFFSNSDNILFVPLTRAYSSCSCFTISCVIPCFRGLYWTVQCFTSPPTQYRLYGRRFLQVKRPNQQYQSTEGSAFEEESLDS